MKKEVKDYIEQYIKEMMPAPRLHHNLSLDSMLHPFSEKYTIKEWITIETIETVRSNVEWDDRSDLSKELLKLMGKSGIKYLSKQFDIVKVSWTDRIGYSLPYYNMNQLRDNQSFTLACFAKHIDGDVPRDNYMEGFTNSGNWEFVGTYSEKRKEGYYNTHPYTNGTGSCYIALPATVTRKIDLNDPADWFGITE